MSSADPYEQRPYSETYTVTIEGPENVDGVRPHRTVTIVFDSWEASEASETDLYDDCRDKVQQWLNEHFPGDILTSDGYDIERSGSPADNDNVIDMRTSA